jgi:4-hydroxy-2-oxoheptanedioate aldolase
MTQVPHVVQRLTRKQHGLAPLGVFISATDPATTELAGWAGYDFVLIDGEHSPLDRLAVLSHIRAAEAVGLVPIVRGLEKSGSFIQSMLDLGAAGVVLPKLETAEEARAAVAATRYAPHGTRGMCPANHDGQYNIAIIETRKAVENIDEIVAVEGMDLIHFGPGDLSADMGLNFATDLPLLQDAWKRVHDATRAAGKFLFSTAGHGFDGADVYIQPMDLIQLQQKFAASIAEFRNNGF